MKAFLLLPVFAWIAGGIGRTLLDRWRGLSLSVGERWACSIAIGLGIAAYGVYALGWLGLLSLLPVTVWWLLLGAMGWRGMRANGNDLAQWYQQRKAKRERDTSEVWPHRVIVAAQVILLVFGVIGLLACLRPPGPLEWDALSYHLADPKLFLQQHRIWLLPTEHHSNFPFTLEMLFAVGLLYDGYALANLFHLLLAALIVLAILGFCHRLLTPLTGYVAAVIFVTTPVVLWEYSVAYIDVGLALYTTLAAFAAMQGLHHKDTKTRREHEEAEAGISRRDAETQRREEGKADSIPEYLNTRTPERSILLAGVLMGFALGIKYLALIPFALIGGWMLIQRVPVRSVAMYAGIALAIGSPWYLKNAVLLRNPVYPFAYRTFADSRYWSVDRGDAYSAEQGRFGAPHSLKSPRESLLNLLSAPYQLLTHDERYSNAGERAFTVLIGGLYAAFGLALLFARPIPRVVTGLMTLALAQIGAWFFVSQVGRYLIGVLPLLAVGCGWAAARLMQWERAKASVLTHICRVVTLTLVAGQAVMVFVMLATMPMGGPERLEAMGRGLLTTAFSLESILSDATQADSGLQRVGKTLNDYQAVQWLNANTDRDTGVVFFDEVLGFYLDRPYLWGNRQHSTFIPYDTLQDGAELTRFLRESPEIRAALHNHSGVRYALFNLRFSPANPEGRALPEDPEMMTNYVQHFIVEAGQSGEPWRRLLADAVQRGLWKPVFYAHSVLVMEMSAP